MRDADKTKKQLIEELVALRQERAALAPMETTRQQAEATLQASEQPYRLLVENSQGLIYVHDLNGLLLTVNPAAAQSLGYEPHEMVGRNLQEFVAPELRHVCPVYLERIRHQPIDSGILRVMTKQGAERLWMYRNVRYEEPGQPAYVLGHAQDITERIQTEEALRQANILMEHRVQERTVALQRLNLQLQKESRERLQTEEALRQSEEFNRKTLESVPVGIIQTTAEGQIVRANDEALRILGRARTELYQCSMADVAPHMLGENGRPYTSADDPVAKCLASGQPQLATTLGIERLDGTVVWTVSVVSPLLATGTATPTGTVMTFLDITARKHLETRLLQTQKMEAIGTLAGGIAHDFNNILTAIVGYTDLALYDIPQTQSVWRHLQQVLQASKRAQDIVQQLLTFSQASRQPRTPVAVHAVVHDVLTLLHASLPTTITMKSHCDDETSMILADAAQIHQLLLHLCANADHAMREAGGLIEVRVETVDIDVAFAAQHAPLKPGAYVRVLIRDTGVGMCPEVIERIYEPFFTTKDVGEGSGMGLAVAYGIMASHEGAIAVQSVPGEGTTFALYFPKLAEMSLSEHCVGNVPLLQRQERILFVDDEPALAKLAQTILTRLGYDAIVCTSSTEALEVFRTTPQHFDLVITDQVMPDMTGEALAAALRHIRADIPIILCSGFSHTLDAARAQEYGIDAFLLKPLTPRELSSAITHVLHQRLAQQL